MAPPTMRPSVPRLPVVEVRRGHPARGGRAGRLRPPGGRRARAGRVVGHQLQGRDGHPARQPRRPRVPARPRRGAGGQRGDDEPDFVPGQRVLVQGYDLGVARHGGFAGYARVPSEWVVPLPDGSAAATPPSSGLAGFTALCPCTGWSGTAPPPGTGRCWSPAPRAGWERRAVALLAHEGFEVVASSGKTSEHDYLESLGAAQVVGRRSPRTTAGRSGRNCGGASSTASAAWPWPRRCAPSATAAPWRRAGYRWKRPGHDRLPLHRPRCGAARDRHRGDADRGAAGPVVGHGRHVPAGPLRADGQRGDRARRADRRRSTACSMPPYAAGPRPSLPLEPARQPPRRQPSGEHVHG